jgi:predicted nucleotidyltransferase
MILRAKDKDRLLAIFDAVKIPIEVWAYGSRVDGSAHEGSDLDLVIRTPDLQKLPLDVFLELKEILRECNIPIVIELFDWARLPESFHKNIMQLHEVLYSNLAAIVKEPNTEYKKK